MAFFKAPQPTGNAPTMASRPRRSVRTAVPTRVATALAGIRAAMTSLPKPTDLASRLAVFPTRNLPLEQPATVYWNDHQVPYVHAASDLDGAFVLGLVHAHLRLGQMELARRISQGRLSELAGPALLDIDKTLRTLGFFRVADANVARMPADARAYADRFVAGVNHYLAGVAELPHEFKLFNLPRQPFTLTDLVTIGRLGGADATWLSWFALMPLLDHPDWELIWRAALEVGGLGAPASLDETRATLPVRDHESGQAMLLALLEKLAKTGSNSAAAGGRRTGTGSAIIASDPHLGVSLPNIWLMAGLSSPSYRVVGMMPAGLPVFALARTEHIAWGGTNLRSAGSDLVDVSGLAASEIRTERHRIKARFRGETEHPVRMTPHGPIITDAPLFPDVNGRTLALKWVGHLPSEEIGALLAVQRATNWTDFRAALADWGVTPQNMVYADVAGNVGIAMATRLPRRHGPPRHVIATPDEVAGPWADIATAADLPALYNPPEGFVVSANTPPVATPFRMATFVSGPDRTLRLRELLSRGGPIGVDEMMAIHRDVLGVASLALKTRLVQRFERLAAAGLLDAITPWREQPALMPVVDWDGRYAAGSHGARAFEALLAAMMPPLFERLGLAAALKAIDASGELKIWLARAVDRVDDATLARLLIAALPVLDRQLADGRVWGDVHRLRLAHPLAAAPVIGKRYRFADIGYPGSIQTLQKSAHPMSGDTHQVRYGSQARHISDLSDPDANYFCLLGGQDGWFNSSTFLDTVDLWLTGTYVRIPLRLETVQATFGTRMELSAG